MLTEDEEKKKKIYENKYLAHICSFINSNYIKNVFEETSKKVNVEKNKYISKRKAFRFLIKEFKKVAIENNLYEEEIEFNTENKILIKQIFGKVSINLKKIYKKKKIIDNYLFILILFNLLSNIPYPIIPIQKFLRILEIYTNYGIYLLKNTNENSFKRRKKIHKIYFEPPFNLLTFIWNQHYLDISLSNILLILNFYYKIYITLKSLKIRDIRLFDNIYILCSSYVNKICSMLWFSIYLIIKRMLLDECEIKIIKKKKTYLILPIFIEIVKIVDVYDDIIKKTNILPLLKLYEKLKFFLFKFIFKLLYNLTIERKIIPRNIFKYFQINKNYIFNKKNKNAINFFLNYKNKKKEDENLKYTFNENLTSTSFLGNLLFSSFCEHFSFNSFSENIKNNDICYSSFSFSFNSICSSLSYIENNEKNENIEIIKNEKDNNDNKNEYNINDNKNEYNINDNNNDSDVKRILNKSYASNESIEISESSLSTYSNLKNNELNILKKKKDDKESYKIIKVYKNKIEILNMKYTNFYIYECKNDNSYILLIKSHFNDYLCALINSFYLYSQNIYTFKYKSEKKYKKKNINNNFFENESIYEIKNNTDSSFSINNNLDNIFMKNYKEKNIEETQIEIEKITSSEFNILEKKENQINKNETFFLKRKYKFLENETIFNILLCFIKIMFKQIFKNLLNKIKNNKSIITLKLYIDIEKISTHDVYICLKKRLKKNCLSLLFSFILKKLIKVYIYKIKQEKLNKKNFEMFQSILIYDTYSFIKLKNELSKIKYNDFFKNKYLKRLIYIKNILTLPYNQLLNIIIKNKYLFYIYDKRIDIKFEQFLYDYKNNLKEKLENKNKIFHNECYNNFDIYLQTNKNEEIYLQNKECTINNKKKDNVQNLCDENNEIEKDKKSVRSLNNKTKNELLNKRKITIEKFQNITEDESYITKNNKNSLNFTIINNRKFFNFINILNDKQINKNLIENFNYYNNNNNNSSSSSSDNLDLNNENKNKVDNILNIFNKNKENVVKVYIKKNDNFERKLLLLKNSGIYFYNSHDSITYDSFYFLMEIKKIYLYEGFFDSLIYSYNLNNKLEEDIFSTTNDELSTKNKSSDTEWQKCGLDSKIIFHNGLRKNIHLMFIDNDYENFIKKMNNLLVNEKDRCFEYTNISCNKNIENKKIDEYLDNINDIKYIEKEFSDNSNFTTLSENSFNENKKMNDTFLNETNNLLNNNYEKNEIDKDDKMKIEENELKENKIQENILNDILQKEIIERNVISSNDINNFFKFEEYKYSSSTTDIYIKENCFSKKQKIKVKKAKSMKNFKNINYNDIYNLFLQEITKLYKNRKEHNLNKKSHNLFFIKSVNMLYFTANNNIL